MTRSRTAVAALLTLLGVGASPLRAQQCRAAAQPSFEFQVERAAEFIPDSTVSPRPHTELQGRAEPQRVVVQFVVDTLGVPDTLSFKVLLNSDAALATATRQAVAKWRYRPAVRDGCRVPQLVQTAVRP